MKFVLGTVTGLMLVGIASGDSVWNSAGKTPRCCQLTLKGSSALGTRRSHAVSEFAGGPPALTGLNSVASQNGPRPFWVAPNNTPLFRLWIADADATPGGNSNALAPFDSSDFESQESGVGPVLQQSKKGLWSDLEIATEPATGILVALGLMCAGLLRPRKRRLKDSTVWENLG
jgi:hypothetical protein